MFSKVALENLNFGGKGGQWFEFFTIDIDINS